MVKFPEALRQVCHAEAKPKHPELKKLDSSLAESAGQNDM